MQHLFDFTTDPPFTDHPLLANLITPGMHNTLTLNGSPVDRVTKFLTGPGGWVETLDIGPEDYYNGDYPKLMGHVVFTTTIHGITYTVGHQ